MANLCAVFLVAREGKPKEIISTNGLEVETYGIALENIAKHFNYPSTDLHLVVIDNDARKKLQYLQRRDQVPDRGFFTFLIRYQNEVWNVYASQSTPQNFRSLASRNKSSSLVGKLDRLPADYKGLIVQLSRKYTNSFELLTRLSDDGTSDQRAKNEDNYFEEYGFSAVWTKAGEMYEAPYGWVGIGVNVDKEIEDQVFKSWHVCYHATSAPAVASILLHRTLALPGDSLLDGSTLAIPEGHIPGENYIFGSPCLSYCEYGYAKPYEGFKFVLQLRMEPGTYKVQGDTLKPPKDNYHPLFPKQNIEWVNPFRDAVVVTRIWIKKIN